MTEPAPDPFARPTEADAERWLRATREGLFPRRRSLMTADEVAARGRRLTWRGDD